MVGKFRNLKNGFSLAEVLLAIGLAAIVLLALVGQNTMLLASNQKLDDTTVATDVAYSIIEQLSSEILADQRQLACIMAPSGGRSPLPLM